MFLWQLICSFQCDQDAVWLDEEEMEEQSNNKAPGLLSREPIRLAQQLQEGAGVYMNITILIWFFFIII